MSHPSYELVLTALLRIYRFTISRGNMIATRLEALIRHAQTDEADTLNELIMRAKAFWGYDQAFLEACRPHLLLKPEVIEQDPVYCAEVGGSVAGISHLIVVSDATIDLDHLFVEPTFIGQGIGGILWRHAVTQARSMGATTLVFEADPLARPFYEQMGAVVVGETISTIIPGRITPRMRFEL
jgi:GNAT superfamily N-acetyltransferase